MINKNRFGVANDKKLLRKIGKQWVTVSALTLVLLGGGAIASSVVTHAATTTPAVEANGNNSIKEQLNSNLDKAYQASQSASGSSVTSSKASQSSVSSSQSSSANKPSNIESKASNMHDTLMLNAVNNSNSTSTSSANAKSSVASTGSLSASAKPSFNSAYQSYMAKMSGTDNEVTKDNNKNTQNNNSNNNQNQPVIKHNLGDTNFFTGATHTGTDDGLNYMAYANGGVEVTGGTAQSDLSSFGVYSDIENAKSIKFDNAIDTSKVTNMSYMFKDDSNLQSLTLPNSFDTSNVTNMSYMFYNDTSLQSLTLPSSFDTSNVTDMGAMFDEDSNLQALTLPNSFNTSKVTDMSYMFDIDGNLQSLTLPSSFDTSKVTDMSAMFTGDSNLQALTLPNSFDTSNVTNISGMFDYDTSLQSLTIQSPNTKINSSSALLPMYKTNGAKDFTGKPYTASEPNDFSDGNIGTFLSPAHIPTDTINYQYNGATKGSQQFKASPSDYVAGKYIISDSYKDLDVTTTNAKLPNGYHLVNNDNDVKFDNGTYNIAIMPNTMTTTVDYQYNGATKGSQTFTANLSDYNVNVNRYNDMDITSSDNIPKGYRLVNANNRVPFDNGTHDVAVVPNSVNVQYHDIYGDSDGLTPPANTAQQVSSDGTYKVTAPQGWALVSSDGFTRAPSASGYVSKNVTVDVAPYTNGLTFDYDKDKNDSTLEFVHRVPSEDDSPYHISDIKNVKSITFGSDAYMNNKAVNIDPVFAQDNNLRKVTIKSNKTKVSVMEPSYDRVFDNDSSFSLRPSSQQIGLWYKMTLFRRTKPQYHLDKRYEFNGAKIYATTPSETINPLSKISEKDNVSVSFPFIYSQALRGRLISRSRQLKAPSTAKLLGEAFVQYPSHNSSHNVYVYYLISTKSATLCIQHDLGTQSSSSDSPFPSLYKEMANGGTAPEPNDFSKGNVGTFVRHASTTINYQYDGKIMATQNFTGAAGTSFDVDSLNDENIPSGYQLVNKDNDFDYNGGKYNVAIEPAPNMVVGTAFLTLLYKKGNRTDGQVLRLHINGNIGDSDIVINPQDYDRDGYSIAPSDKDWHIPFDYNDVKHVTNDFSRYNVENTFTYKANATDIKIQYVDTQTKSNIGSSDDLGQIAYDGDTADLQGTDDNNVLSVDGKEYHLNLPSGYHLAHTNNYITVTANSTYVKPVTTVGGTRMLRMPLMKLTLSITPHFNKHTTKPASSSSVTPVKPSSASPVRPNSASSMASSSASQSVAPSSTASVTPIVLPSSEASSTSKPSSVAPASEATEPKSMSESPAPSIAKKPVTHRISHKKMAKHDTHQLNHQVTKATKQLNTVERHMEARKAIIRKATHAKRTIKHANKRLHYLRHNKRHVAHALRHITRNKVAIKRAKRVVRTAKQARPSFVHAKAAPVGPTTDKFTAPSVKASVVTPKVHAKSTATTYANRKKLPQTSEATDHAGIVAIILMIMSVILAGFDKAFGREHN